jgi:hypothetical protein
MMPSCFPRIGLVAPGTLAAAAIGLLLLIEPRRAHGYIDSPEPTLAQLCKRSTEIAVLQVEKVNREKLGIVYRKVRNLKGDFASATKHPFTHVLLATPGYITNPANIMDAESQRQQNQGTLAAVTEGRKAVVFQVGQLQLICVGHYWYTLRVSADAAAPLGGACDARFARFFCGDVELLVTAVADLLTGKAVVVPRMAGSNKMLSDRSAPIRWLRADDDDATDRRKENGVAHQFRDPFSRQASWSTHRGNAQRTGSDASPGPRNPKILWVRPSDNHSVAALVPAQLERCWKDLLAKYEPEQKKAPDFTQPDEASVSRQTKDKRHADAPVAHVEDRLLTASLHLDDAKAGERALVCLKAGDGTVLWKAPLKLNPWAGPTVGPYVLVGSSSIGMDPKGIPGATGEVVAVDLDTGKVKWRKEVPGGVLSSVAVKAGLAIFTATDGKVRTWDAFTGQEKWTYDAQAPFFAGPAVASNLVYAADWKGVVHALTIADGKKEWTLDLRSDPAVKTPDMVYISPVVHRGRLYLTTCSLGVPAGPRSNVVICIGEK